VVSWWANRRAVAGDGGAFGDRLFCFPGDRSEYGRVVHSGQSTPHHHPGTRQTGSTDTMTASEHEDPTSRVLKAGAWRWERALLLCGVVAGPLFVAAVLLQGALRPEYDPLRHSISTLALGSAFGWIQSLNFLVAGGLTLAFALGVRRVLRVEMRSIWGPALL